MSPDYDHRNSTAVEIIFTNYFEQIEKKESVYVQERELLIWVTFEIKVLWLLSQHIAYLIRSV
jgi:hypothetical protein